MLDASARQGILKPIRLVLVDPQPIVLQGLRSVLGTQPDFEVVATSGDGTSCLEAIRNLTPDVALLADRVPDLTVSEILAIVKAEKLSTRLVFFTESDTDHDLASAIAAGACSAISKYASPATMLRSLRLMTKSGVALAKSDLSATGKEADGDGKVEKMLELLTQRERQIARLVAEGLSNKEIARQLNVSDGTVKVHLYNIFQKLEITNRTVLATIALLQRPSGLAALSLAFLALAIADELKASEASDIFPDDNSVGHTGEHAGYEHAAYEPWKKGILRHLVVWESGETPTQAQRDLFAKAAQITNPAAAMEALRAAEQSGGATPWTHHAPAGSSAPDLPARLLREAIDIQTGDDPAPEHQFPRLLSNAMSMHGGSGNFAVLTGALIYALQDPHLAAHAHDLREASSDSILAVTQESATTKLAAISHAAANHDDNSAPSFLSHDIRLSSAGVTTGHDNAAHEGAPGQRDAGDAGDNLHKPVGADLGHDASIGVGGNVENVVYRSPIDSKSTASDTVFDFASGPGRINLAAFGALAWLHMTAAAKSIPPHTLAWVYDSASNETIVYVNATDRILDIGDRSLLEIHLEGIVSIAEADAASAMDGAAVVATLEQLEAVLISATETDEAVSSKDHVQTTIEGGESSLGTAGAWALLASGSGFQFGQGRTGLGTSTSLGSSTDASADATEESDGASAASAHASSIEPAHSATAPAAANVTSNSGPANTGAGFSSTAPNEIGQPSVVTADNAGHGNSQHAPDPSTDGSKPGNGAEHHDKGPEAPGGSAKKAEPDGAEHGKAGHSNAPDAADIDPGAAAAASAGHGNSKHASEPGSAKAAAHESTEAGSKPAKGVGNGAEHHDKASDPAGGAAKKEEPAGAEHGKPGHSTAPDAADMDPGAAAAASAGHGNSQHASKPESAKAAASESTEAGSKSDNGAGNGADHHHASASDAAHGPAKTAEPGGTEHGKSGHSSAANAPDAAETDPGAATAANPGHGNAQHASEPGSAKVASTESTEAGSKPGNGVGHGAEHHASASEPAGAVKTAEPATVDHGNSENELHSTSANASQAADIGEPSVASGGNPAHGNSQHAAQPAAIASEDAHPAKAALGIGGMDQGPVFRFDSGATPSALVAVVELKQLNNLLDPHVPPGQAEDLVKIVPHALSGHADDHGNNGAHQAIVPAHHDLLI
ncbi:DNAbinding response regulator LuxR family [Bradyrhizobium sp.]|uniref:response regulator transcription factor n=1 Tax=Bradyrhizobium sp. TaxID=376 RepID=UPI0007C1B596|nr:response regulator transcription factor [Bradyrhizobium sp.]CUT11242.1 DNAbinding response regulator LuxR family [Bradyrhizobium sp.]